MAARPYVIGNWKMAGAPGDAAMMARRLREEAVAASDVTAVLCPPAALLQEAAEALGLSSLGAARGTVGHEDGGGPALGGQDCHHEGEGAHTGETSPELLFALGARYCIVGHSETREERRLRDADVAAKARGAARAGLIPVICVGESAAAREAGRAEAVVAAQVGALSAAFADLPGASFLLAYEPIWAIGAGGAPGAEVIEPMHAVLEAALDRAQLTDSCLARLYGGSVAPDNARDILTMNGVGGVLVGAASRRPEDFSAIIAAASRKRASLMMTDDR